MLPFKPSGEKLGAYHAAEIAYAFNNIELLRDNAPDNHKQLAEAMSDYWVAFAKTGQPNARGLPKWLPFSKADRQYIQLDEKIQPKKDLLPGIWEFHDKVRLEQAR